MMITWLQHIDWNLVSGFGTLIAALAAAIALIQQSRLTRFSIGTELLMTLEERFEDNEKMRGYRKRAALALLEGEIATELDMVIDFFESIGTYLRKGMLDDYIIYCMFYTRAMGYWVGSEEYVNETRAKDRTIWENYEYLIKRLRKIEARMQGKPLKNINMSSEDVNMFLKNESRNLDPVQTPNQLDDMDGILGKHNTIKVTSHAQMLISGALAFLAGFLISKVHKSSTRV